MKVILLLCLQFLLVGHSLAEYAIVRLTAQDADKISKYLFSEDSKPSLFPLKLSRNQVKLYGFTSGVHRIMPGPGESMISIHGEYLLPDKRLIRLVYIFTVTPEIDYRKIGDNNWKDLLSTRKVTQYVVIEKKNDKEFAYEKMVMKVRQKYSKTRKQTEIK